MALPVLNPSTIPYGSRVLTINSVTYVAENFTVNRPTKIIERFNEVDLINGQVVTAAAVTGSATLQLALAATAYPAQGDTFTTTIGYGSETFVVCDVDTPESQGAVKLVNITFRKQVT